jgi:hypothetical protein
MRSQNDLILKKLNRNFSIYIYFNFIQSASSNIFLTVFLLSIFYTNIHNVYVYGSGLPRMWQEASDRREYIGRGLTKVIRGSIKYNGAGRECSRRMDAEIRG